ncbi:MAG: hypothetical protein R2801_01125 [Chitinophagales bacterium]
MDTLLREKNTMYKLRRWTLCFWKMEFKMPLQQVCVATCEEVN